MTRIRYRCPVTGKRESVPVTATQRVETPNGVAITATVVCVCGSEHEFTVIQVRDA